MQHRKKCFIFPPEITLLMFFSIVFVCYIVYFILVVVLARKRPFKILFPFTSHLLFNMLPQVTCDGRNLKKTTGSILSNPLMIL